LHVDSKGDGMNALVLLIGFGLGTYLVQKDVRHKRLPWLPLLLASSLLLMAVVARHFGL
jgi:hypothetical protein